jgi:hypothetical protein
MRCRRGKFEDKIICIDCTAFTTDKRPLLVGDKAVYTCGRVQVAGANNEDDVERTDTALIAIANNNKELIRCMSRKLVDVFD